MVDWYELPEVLAKIVSNVPDVRNPLRPVPCPELSNTFNSAAGAGRPSVIILTGPAGLPA